MSGLTLQLYREALARGRLAVARCEACGAQQAFPADSCFTCGSERLRLGEHDGAGTIFSWVVNHYAFSEALAAETPYVVLLVALSGGGRLYARLAWDGEGVPALQGDRPVVLDGEASRTRGYPVYRLA